MRNSFIACALGLLALAAPSIAAASPASTTPEQGYDLGEIEHPRSVAMAGANEALGGSTTAIFVNPANLVLYRVYHLEALAAFMPEARRQSYGGAIADSSTSRLAGGFGGTWSQMDPDGIKRTWTDLRLTLAYPLGDRLAVGLTGRYLRASQATNGGPFGASLASGGTSGDPLFNAFTFDAGAAVQITEQVRLGISGRNLTATGSGLAPLVLAGGLGFSNGTFTLEGDSLVDFTTYNSARARFNLGGEILVADRFPIRGGYRYDAGTKAHSVGLGLGYVDRKFSIELGGRRDVVADHPATLISIGLRLFIDSGAGTGQGEMGPGGDGF